jgi:DNA-binding transcriptional LysR family regulator
MVQVQLTDPSATLQLPGNAILHGEVIACVDESDAMVQAAIAGRLVRIISFVEAPVQSNAVVMEPARGTRPRVHKVD